MYRILYKLLARKNRSIFNIYKNSLKLLYLNLKVSKIILLVKQIISFTISLL